MLTPEQNRMMRQRDLLANTNGCTPAEVEQRQLKVVELTKKLAAQGIGHTHPARSTIVDGLTPEQQMAWFEAQMESIHQEVTDLQAARAERRRRSAQDHGWVAPMFDAQRTLIVWLLVMFGCSLISLAYTVVTAVAK